MKMKLWSISLALLPLLLIACGGASVKPVPVAPQATATDVVVAPATNIPARQPVEAMADDDTANNGETAETLEPKPVAPPPEEMAEKESEQEIIDAANEETVKEDPETAQMEADATPGAEVNWLTVEGKTEDDLTYLGNPDAPITMIDYSDFL